MNMYRYTHLCYISFYLIVVGCDIMIIKSGARVQTPACNNSEETKEVQPSAIDSFKAWQIYIT